MFILKKEANCIVLILKNVSREVNNSFSKGIVNKTVALEVKRWYQDQEELVDLELLL